MKVYLDEKSDNINIVQSTASASSMISSIAGEVKQYVLSRFPKDFFKHVYIDTAQTVSEQRKNDRYNETANKIPYPSLAITPEISLDDPIGGMEKSVYLSSPNLYLRRDINRTYRKIIIDPEQKFSMYYTSDYITTNFNFKVTVNSFIQNTDCAFYLKSKFQKDFFQFYNDRYIQTEIPKSFIQMIADLYGWNLNRAEDMDQLRLYLIGTGKTEQNIEKRVSLNTGKQCFFLNEKVNLLLLFTDLDCPSSINRNSQVEGDYTLTFRIQASTWVPNNFILVIDKKLIPKMSDSTATYLLSDSDQQEDGYFSTHVVNKNEKNVLRKKDTIYFNDASGEKQIGHLIYNEIFTYKLGTPIPDMYLMEKLPDEFKSIYSYGLNVMHLDMSSFIYPLLYNVQRKLVEGEDFILNYTTEIPKTKGKKPSIAFFDNTLKLSIKKDLGCDVSVALYVNRLLYETIKKAIKFDKNYFHNNYMTTIMGVVGREQVEFKVKSFVNKDEFYTADLNKSLRIKTAYGIGYISTLEDNEEDGYKICLGFDENNEPIIRKLEMERK